VWWVFLVLGTIITTVLGEVVCLKRELREIPLSSSSSSNSSSGGSSSLEV
jgi:hypothetical protein